MAEKLTKREWETIIDDIAVEAGQQWLQDMHDRGWYEANDLGQRGNYEQVKHYLMSQYPYESVTNEDMDKLQRIKPLGWATFLNKNGPDPRIPYEAAEMKKYLPLLMGVAKDKQDWYSVDAPKLKYMASGEDFKFPYTKEGFREFLGNLAKYQQMYDRGELVKEMHNDPRYLIGSLVAPSATAEIDNAVATGADLDASTVGKLAALDVATNGAIFAAPEFAVTGKSAPILNYITKGRNAWTPILDAGVQGVVETGRQYGKTKLSETGQQMDWTAPILASSTGATRPALVTTTQSVLNKLGPGFRDFAKGVGRATRSGDPTAAERDYLEKLLHIYNRDVPKKKAMSPSATNRYGTNELLPHGEFLELKAANGDNVNKYLELFKIGKNKDGTINVNEVLKQYDMPIYDVVGRNSDNVYLARSGGLPSNANQIPNKSGFVNMTDTDNLYKQLFPVKYNLEENKATRAGLKFGNAIGDLGSRVEPAIKGNPLDALNALMNSESSKTKYKDEAWYKLLTAEQQEIIDEAFRSKNK